jgi:hypothetical protein
MIHITHTGNTIISNATAGGVALKQQSGGRLE